MERLNLDENWTFRRGFLDNIGMLESDPGTSVDLPNDSMIGTTVSADAPAGYDSGYFNGDAGNYTKYISVPEDWKNDSVGLEFDGSMMHTVIEVNGCKVAEHHYGYSPFYVDITDYVAFGEENRITVHTNTGIQSSSRWYTGAGLYRSVKLCHGPKVHIANNGIYLYTKEVDCTIKSRAFIEALIDVENASGDNCLAEVTLSLSKACGDAASASNTSVSNPVVSTTRTILVNSRSAETARMAFILENPLMWDVDSPNLYDVKVTVKNIGKYRTHFEAAGVERTTSANNAATAVTVDTATTIFGVRTITADAVRGLRINGKTVKLKGGCVHHDNGLIGAASLYESEARKVKKLKEVGFNAIRTAHNPPSAALVEACDRLGLYIFDEAFDAWGIAKRIGDYSNYFKYEWENDLTAFVRRDRVHPSIIMWSTGNEIPERGGLNNGYTVATLLAEKIRSLDATRPISNGICSYWSGLDDYLAKNQSHEQNANDSVGSDAWERRSEPFTNGLDVVGYNYLEQYYERDHELYPERVMLGSENFPQEIGFRWPVVEKLPYLIGDFTWTAWDYIGEAGIGKALYVDADHPFAKQGPWGVMPPATTVYPWRLANDADFDITGRMLPQGEYRSVVWGNKETFLYTKHPDTFGKTEVMSMWGFPAVVKNWNYAGYEGKPIELVVFSNADEVEILIGGKTGNLVDAGMKSLGKKSVCKEGKMPNSVSFDAVYEPGEVVAISYCGGAEISRAKLQTSGAPAKLVLTPEKTEMRADCHDLIYVGIDVVDSDGLLVTDAEINLVSGLSVVGKASDKIAYLAGFGTGNPITEEDYTDNKTTTYRGHATAIIRSGYVPGEIELNVSAAGLESESVKLVVK